MNVYLPFTVSSILSKVDLSERYLFMEKINDSTLAIASSSVSNTGTMGGGIASGLLSNSILSLSSHDRAFLAMSL